MSGGARENRADAAATVLRWLIGDDDRVPVRCENPGELVGGFGDVVHSREQIAAVLAFATQRQRSSSWARPWQTATIRMPLPARKGALQLRGVLTQSALRV